MRLSIERRLDRLEASLRAYKAWLGTAREVVPERAPPAGLVTVGGWSGTADQFRDLVRAKLLELGDDLDRPRSKRKRR